MLTVNSPILQTRHACCPTMCFRVFFIFTASLCMTLFSLFALLVEYCFLLKMYATLSPKILLLERKIKISYNFRPFLRLSSGYIIWSSYPSLMNRNPGGLRIVPVLLSHGEKVVRKCCFHSEKTTQNIRCVQFIAEWKTSATEIWQQALTGESVAPSVLSLLQQRSLVVQRW